MAKVYENEFKVTILEILNSGRRLEESNLNDSMLQRWKRKYLPKSGDFTKKRTRIADKLEFSRYFRFINPEKG